MSAELLQQVAFMVLAGMTVGGAWGVVRARSVFVSALWLILSFIGVAGLYVMLSAPLLAVVQILIYVGAISVLILFAIMLTEDVMGEAKPTAQWPLAAMIVGTLASLLMVVSFTTDWTLTQGTVSAGDAVIEESVAGKLPTAMSVEGAYQIPEQIVMLGRSLMSEHLLSFEVVAVILLVALVGAIVIARD